MPAVLKDGHIIQILTNCADINRRHLSHQFPDNDWDEVCVCFITSHRDKESIGILTSDIRVIQVSLNATFALCRDVGGHMLAQPLPTSGRCGRIINFSSLLSFQGGLNIPAYAASKGAVSQLTKLLSNEWAGQGITVNAIAPGYVATDMNIPLLDNPERLRSINERIPAGRWGKTEDFKAAAVYLCGSDGAYANSQILAIDGGRLGR